MGRVCVDLYPMQLGRRSRRSRASTSTWAGSPATSPPASPVWACASAIVSAVGDDGHGRFVRRFLESEGVDCRWLSVAPHTATALAFCEAWPPDRFPITFYRTPTCPDWELDAGRRSTWTAIAAAPLAYVSGTGLAREPSRLATMAVAGGAGRRAPGRPCSTSTGGRCCGTTRPTTPPPSRVCARMADLVLGSDEEIAAAVGANAPARLLALGAARGRPEARARGATVHVAQRRARAHPALPGRGRERPRRRRRLRRRLRLAAAARRSARAGGRRSQPGRSARGRAAGLLDRNAHEGDLS